MRRCAVINWNQPLNTPVLASRGWRADLHLGFAPGSTKTLLVQRAHTGPLTVQRPFYPEGEVCHVYILHPPGGIVGGDELHIGAEVASGAHALITTPAAGKFYRSAGAVAKQTIELNIAKDATLEWLPQEAIIYQGAQLQSSVRVNLAAGAHFIGWEISVLGRPASQEGFDVGAADLRWQIMFEQQPILLERLRLDASAFAARWGLQGCSTCGSLFATPVSTACFSAVQNLVADIPGCGVTLIDGLLICRALDTRADRLRLLFEQLWRQIRQDVMAKAACAPRIWAT